MLAPVHLNHRPGVSLERVHMSCIDATLATWSPPAWKRECLATQFSDPKAQSCESEMLICFSNGSTGVEEGGGGREESEQERQ